MSRVQLMTPPQQQQHPPRPRERRLTTSRSAGDLIHLAKLASNSSARAAAAAGEKTSTLSRKEVRKETFKGVSPPRAAAAAAAAAGPSPLDPEAAVVCGELHRLSQFGIWCRLWLELRLSYLLFFYQREDALPLDVVQLRGCTIHKAPECDHLEGLFPLKIACRDQGITYFFYAESEECRVRWVVAFCRASAQKPSRVIQGLNLEPEAPKVEDPKQHWMNRANLLDAAADPWPAFVKQLGAEEEEEEAAWPLHATLPNLVLTSPQALRDRETAIRTKYDRAHELAEHEVLRRSTYYMQRRESAQIKVQTLVHGMGAGARDDTKAKTLQQLLDRLNVIEVRKEETERAAEQTLHALQATKEKQLRSLRRSGEPPPPRLLRAAAVAAEETASQPNITIILPRVPASPPRTGVLKRREGGGGGRKDKKRSAVNRHSTFSPGDWTASAHDDDKSARLRKALSQEDLHNKQQQQQPTDRSGGGEKSKRRGGPLRFLSNAMRGSKRAQSEDSLSLPLTPPTSPKTPKSPGSRLGLKQRFFLRSISQQDPRRSNSSSSPPLSPSFVSHTPDETDDVFTLESALASAFAAGSPSSGSGGESPTMAEQQPATPSSSSSRRKAIKRFFSFSSGKHKEPRTSLS